MFKKFTFIELIVVVAILGILTAIIIPKINDMKMKSELTATYSNMKQLQTSVDIYRLNESNVLPSSKAVRIEQPREISFSTLIDGYIKNVPKNKDLIYWIDYWGNVFISDTDAPTGLHRITDTLHWNDVDKAKTYRIYEVVNHNQTSKLQLEKKVFLGETSDTNFKPNHYEDNKVYLVSSVDENGLESAASGEGYISVIEDSLFIHTYGGSANDGLRSVQQTKDGGYIGFGYSASNNGDVKQNRGQHDFVVGKFARDGASEWLKTYGGTGNDVFYASTPTKDGGFIAVGSTTSANGDVPSNRGAEDFVIAKFDAKGTLLWLKTYGGTGSDELFDVKESKNGDIVIVGKTSSNNGDLSLNQGNIDFFVGKLNPDGSKQWFKTYGGTNNDLLQSVVIMDDDSIMASGYSFSKNGDLPTTNRGGSDMVLAKFTSNGNKQWIKSFGGSGVDVFYALTKTNDGGVVASGNSSSNNGDIPSNHSGSNAVLTKFNANGDKIWLNTLGGNGDDNFNYTIQTQDGGYLSVGLSTSNNGDIPSNYGINDMLIAKFNHLGQKEWVNVYGGTKNDYLNYVIPDIEGNFVAVGVTNSNDLDIAKNQGGNDMLLISFDAKGNIQKSTP